MALRNTQNTNVNSLITTGQAAASLDPPCSPENVRRLARIGRLPVAAIVGRGQMLFHRVDVERLAEERRRARARAHGNEAA